MLCIFHGYGARMLLDRLREAARYPAWLLSSAGGGRRVRGSSVWFVLGWLTISASPTAPTPSRPTRGKPGSGVVETVRGWLSVNQRSWRDVSGTRLDEPLAPSDVRVGGFVWA